MTEKSIYGLQAAMRFRARYETARRWAEQRTREELEHTVAKLFERQSVGSPKRLLSMGRGEIQRRFDAYLATEHAKRAKGGNVRAANDPRTPAKAEAKKLWLARREGKHPALSSSNVKFAMEVMRRWPVLKSQAAIEGWCAKWEKERRAAHTPKAT